MVGALATNLHEGSRSEYLAQYIFASFGTSVPVPHQEDTGVDLYCTLTEAIGSRSWPRAYFAVQVKSTMDSWHFDSAESVRWLVEHPLPLFLCVVDKHQARIRVYHTAPRFYVWSVPPSPDHVELVPTTDSEGECTQWEGSGTFSLSAPILDASVQELLQDEFYKSARDVLQFWIEVDLANLHRLKTGMRFFWMPAKYKPNGHAYGGRVMQGTNKADSIEAPMASMKELAAYLAVQLRWRGDLAGATRCALLLRHFFKDDTSGVTHDFFLHQAINTLVKGGEQNYLFRGVDALNTVIDEALGLPDTVDPRGPKGK